MSRTPTDSQKNAINTRDKSILLSAAAGSGKTFTLIRRIIESLTDKDAPLDLSRMLIVTFTRSAASELRERISDALSSALASDPTNAHLCRQSVLIGSAEICTIDSFCLDVVRSEFQRLTFDDGSPIPPDLRLADDTELNTLRVSVMNEVIDKWYAKSSDEYRFARFAENFTGTRDEGNLIESLINYTSMLDNVKDPDNFTAHYAEIMQKEAESDFFTTDYGITVKEYLKGALEYYANFSDYVARIYSNKDAAEERYRPVFISDRDYFRSVIKALDVSYEETQKTVSLYSPMRLIKLKGQEDDCFDNCKNTRDSVKKEFRSLCEKYLSQSPENIRTLTERTAHDVKILSEVIADYRREYAKAKFNERIAEFSDIKRLAHRLLVDENGNPTQTALELRLRYDAVYIDEYQDVDRIQDEIFSAVSKEGCRFVVGDIKQSIYAFRGAEPSVFGNMRNRLPLYGTEDAKHSHECSMFMSENFRCDKPIIDFVNRVSRHTFVPSNGTVNYCDADDLICKASDSYANPVTVAILNTGDGDNKTDENPEIVYVVNEIKRLLLDNELTNNGKRLKPSDIAVLCRGKALVGDIAHALEAVNIPSVDETSSDLFANPEIQLVLSLCQTIDNPEKDIPLAAVLRSPFFDFSMDDLVNIRASSDTSYSLYGALEALSETVSDRDALCNKCTAFVNRLDSLRRDCRTSPVDRFVRRLYREFGVMSLTSDDGRPAEKISINLRRFYEFARTYSSVKNGGFSGFIGFVEKIIEGKTSISAPSVAAPDGAVKIMTIHKSKGLEFPVVFVCGIGKAFNAKDRSKNLLFSDDLGVAMKLSDDVGFAKADTVQRLAIAAAVAEEQTEEEMRILYVALTRARERLYVTGAMARDFQISLNEAAFRSQFECRHSILSAKSYMPWILAAVAEKPDIVKIVTELPQIDGELDESKKPNDKSDDRAKDGLLDILRDRFSFVYHDKRSGRIPAKISVSKLYPNMLDDDASDLQEDARPLRLVPSKPLFLQEEAVRATGAERGTATHLFMQFCDFSRAEKNGVREELAYLVENRFIPKGTAELINIRQIERFFRSDIYKALKNARQVWRETRFNLLFPANDFTTDEAEKQALDGEMITVQGVIDLFFTDANGKVILCDYKTDYLSPEELADEEKAAKKLIAAHSQQLKYYAVAVENLLGKRPDIICLYSLPLGKTIAL